MACTLGPGCDVVRGAGVRLTGCRIKIVWQRPNTDRRPMSRRLLGRAVWANAERDREGDGVVSFTLGALPVLVLVYER